MKNPTAGSATRSRVRTLAAGSRWLPNAISGGIRIGGGDLADFDAATRREWLVTNGIGGFASGTVGGARTRRYHGLLTAALNPPLGRTVMLAKLDLSVSYLGRLFDLSSSEFGDGTISGDGHKYVESFSLQGSLPVWRYAFADVVLEQRIWMRHGENTTYLQLAVLRASAPLEIRVVPLVTWRDYHAHTRGRTSIAAEPVDGGVLIRPYEGGPACRVVGSDGRYLSDPDWYWGYRHRVEARRGLDDTEDLFRPGYFELTLAQAQHATVVATAEPGRVEPPDRALVAEIHRQDALLPPSTRHAPAWVRQLFLAADQFIVRRGTEGGRTVIAGYPWFGDWGRDTMIALPGLTLATGRYDVARSILLTFAGHVSEGMLPNRFPDAGEAPEYNTVDATLWYFHAIDEYLSATADAAFAREIYPVLADIVDWHRRGTRYSIHVDPDDGLLHAGEAGVQLTWMDAKVGDWVVTPRIGKPVEINALWHHALLVMSRLATRLADPQAAGEYRRQAAQVAERFRERFWNGRRNFLYDVIDGPEGEESADGRRVDASLRPNQLFAVSLSQTLLSDEQARAVVDLCARELYTPVGMRSLAGSDSRFVARYGGGPRERDGAYHQGTVWSWLLGPFAMAHYRVYRHAALARSFLEGIALHLEDGCLGQVSEIFDATAPYAPRGCTAQAWSVAEILRAWLLLGAKSVPRHNGEELR